MTDHANELRRYSRKIGHPAGDVPSVMLAAAGEIERLAARLEAAEKELAELRSSMKFRTSLIGRTEAERDALRAKIERMEKMQDALRRHHEMAMGAGLDPSHSLTKLRVSAYQQTCLYADTVAALEE